MGLIAIGKFVMKNKEHICALQPYEQGMLLYTLHYQPVCPGYLRGHTCKATGNWG